MVFCGNGLGRPSLLSYPFLIPLERMTIRVFIPGACLLHAMVRLICIAAITPIPSFCLGAIQPGQLATARARPFGYHHCSRVRKQTKLHRSFLLICAILVSHVRACAVQCAFNLPTLRNAAGAPHPLCLWGSWFSPVPSSGARPGQPITCLTIISRTPLVVTTSPSTSAHIDVSPLSHLSYATSSFSKNHE